MVLASLSCISRPPPPVIVDVGAAATAELVSVLSVSKNRTATFTQDSSLPIPLKQTLLPRVILRWSSFLIRDKVRVISSSVVSAGERSSSLRTQAFLERFVRF